MAKHPDELFTLVGDPEALPDALFEALAGLLLDIDQADQARRDVEEQGS